MKAKPGNLYISVVGRAKVGKSLLIECIFNQWDFTDDVLTKKTSALKNQSIKRLPNGSVVILNTIVIDDQTDPNRNKIIKTTKWISNSDFVIFVLDAREELYKRETEVISALQSSWVPYLIAVNKIEYGTNPFLLSELDALEVTYFELSCKENAGIENFRKKLIRMLPCEKQA
jgi:predicted GTPase